MNHFLVENKMERHIIIMLWPILQEAFLSDMSLKINEAFFGNFYCTQVQAKGLTAVQGMVSKFLSALFFKVM